MKTKLCLKQYTYHDIIKKNGRKYYMGFSTKTLDFLFENSLHDSREWYNEHKPDYIKHVVEPFHELVTELTPTMLEIDDKLICNPKKLSRLFRDARFSRGKSIFRDDVWYSFMRRKEPFQSVPEIFISVSPNSFCYGCGYYSASFESMEAIRSLILNNDISFKKALKAYESQSTFTMEGDLYKKNKYPDKTEKLCNWLNRKSIYFIRNCTDFNILFDESFADNLKAEFSSIAPIYQLFIKGEELARKNENSLVKTKL